MTAEIVPFDFKGQERDEEWHAIPGFDGYEITADGHVRSWKRGGEPRP